MTERDFFEVLCSDSTRRRSQGAGYMILKNRDDAEDAFAEAQVELIGERATLPFLTEAYVVNRTVRVACRRLKMLRRLPCLSEEVIALLGQRSTPRVGNDDDPDERDARVAEAMLALLPHERDVIDRRHVLDQPYADIAKEMEITVRAAQCLRARAIAKLRKLLSEPGRRANRGPRGSRS